MEPIDFPTLQEIQEAIKRLKKASFPTFSEGMNIYDYVNEVSDILSKEFGFQLNIIQPFKQRKFSLKFFRVRELESISNIDLFREHSYPPINQTKMNRCNFPEYPVFYCSDNAFTALLETAREYGNNGKKYCISRWEIEKTDNELVFQTFLQTELSPANHFNNLRDNIMERIGEPFYKEFGERMGKDKEDGLIEYLRYLDGCFINDTNYSLSASLAHRALYPDHNIPTDILMYPSVQTKFRGVNMAIRPNFVDQQMRIKRVYVVELNKYDPIAGKVNVTIFRYADVVKNKFIWNEVNPDDERYNDELLIEDFGQFVSSKYERNPN